VNGVVADTSIWIEFFAGRDSGALESALADDLVIVSPIVVAELLSGTSRIRHLRQVVSILRMLPLHPTPFSHWARVGELRRKLRATGLTISTADAHVAQYALDQGGPLLTKDAIFGKVARHCGLEIL
jgi:predicted nucleic acid-binding protein